MPDHDFAFTYDTPSSSDSCPPTGSTATYREICIRADLLTTLQPLEPTVIHEVTHVFQNEIPQYPDRSREPTAVAVAMILSTSTSASAWPTADYSMIAENGPAIYADAAAFNVYLPSNGFEKLYAYNPSFLQDYNAQIGNGRNPYNAILGEAVIDARPISRWVYDQSIGSVGPTENGGLYLESYSSIDGTMYLTTIALWQWNGETTSSTKVAPQKVTCQIYQLTGQLIETLPGNPQSDGTNWCQDTQFSSIDDAVRTDVQVDTPTGTITRHLITFRYRSTTDQEEHTGKPTIAQSSHWARWRSLPERQAGPESQKSMESE